MTQEESDNFSEHGQTLPFHKQLENVAAEMLCLNPQGTLDEMSRLSARNIQLERENNQLREALKQCAKAIHSLTFHTIELPSPVWKEIRASYELPSVQAALKTKDKLKPTQ